MNIISKIIIILSSSIVIIDTTAFIVGGVWLAYDGVWSAIGFGLFGSIIIAICLSIIMSMSAILLVPSMYFYKNNLKLLYYLSLIPFIVAAAVVMSLFYIAVFNQFYEYIPRTHPIPILLWSYSIATGVLGMIGSNSTNDEKFGYGMFVLFSKLAFIAFTLSVFFGMSKLSALTTSIVFNLIGVGIVIIFSAASMAAKKDH